MNADDKGPDGKSWREAILVGGLALSLPGLLFAPALFGYWLDQAFETKPWLTLIFLFIGLLGAARSVYTMLKRMKVIG